MWFKFLEGHSLNLREFTIKLILKSLIITVGWLMIGFALSFLFNWPNPLESKKIAIVAFIISTGAFATATKFVLHREVPTAAPAAIIAVFIAITATLGSSLLTMDKRKDMLSVGTTMASDKALSALRDDIAKWDAIEATRKAFDRQTSSMELLGKNFRLGEPTLQLINKHQLWVFPLEHKNFYSALTNTDIPGYFAAARSNDGRRVVSEFIPRSYQLSTTGLLDRDIKRYQWFHSLGRRTNTHFEINDLGTPFWVSSVKERVQYGINELGGVIITDAQTGESAFYSPKNIPGWVDYAFSADLTHEYLDYQNALTRKDAPTFATIGLTLTKDPISSLPVVEMNQRLYWVDIDREGEGVRLIDTLTGAVINTGMGKFDKASQRLISEISTL